VNRPYIVLLLVSLFLLAGSSPAFSQTVNYMADYKVEGDIWIDMQVGHRCNSGAEQKQTVRGSGKMSKKMSVAMTEGKITVEDSNRITTAADALRNLTVTSVIKLCSPPKHTYDDNMFSGPVALGGFYGDADQPRFWVLQAGANGGWSGEHWSEYADQWESISDQIWAVRLEAYPGESGRLRQEYEAAYGPYSGGRLLEDDDRWRLRSDGKRAERGPYYVGDYFRMSQTATTSMGELRRYVNISSPWSHGYLFIDGTITGFSEIRESFRLRNIRAGSELDPDWFELF